MDTIATEPLSDAAKRWTLIVVCAATAMLMLDIAVVNTALSRIAEDLGTGLSGLQWIVDAYTLTLASVVLTCGVLADRFGRKRLFVIGLVLFTLTSGACAAAGDIVFLDVARAAQGVGAAILFATALAILADAFPARRERAGGLAVYGATIGASFALGPLVGGALTTGLDWQWIFLINLPLGAACLWITLRKVRESRDPATPPVDWPGQAALIGGLFLLVLALLHGNEDGWGSATILAELAGAGLLLVAFVLIEMRSTHPMLPLRFFRNPSFTGAQIAALGISASIFAVFLYVTLYLQQILGLTAIETGLVYLPTTIVVFIVSGATSSLGERFAARWMVSVGLGLVAVGMAWMTVSGVSSSWTVLLPGMVVSGVGMGLFNPAVIAVALASVPLENSGLAAGVNDTFRQAGTAIGVAGLGALVPADAALGGGSPQAYVDGMHNALLVGAGLAAVCAVVAGFLIGRVPREPELNLPGERELARVG